MNDNDKIVPITPKQNAVPVPNTPQGMINTGSGVQVGTNAGTMNLNINCLTPELMQGLMSMFAAQPVPQKVSHAIEWASLSTERYCLFVLENEEYNCGAFSIAKGKALQDYTPPAYKEHYQALSPSTIAELTAMPCIFAKRNKYYNHTDANHPALLGRITSACIQPETIKLCFSGFQAFPQQLLNENIGLFHLYFSSLRNELDEEHWSIKDGNLPEVLAQLNISVE